MEHQWWQGGQRPACLNGDDEDKVDAGGDGGKVDADGDKVDAGGDGNGGHQQAKTSRAFLLWVGLSTE